MGTLHAILPTTAYPSRTYQGCGQFRSVSADCLRVSPSAWKTLWTTHSRLSESIDRPSGRLPRAGRTSCSAGTTIPPSAPPSSTPWWTPANQGAWIPASGWKMCCCRSPAMKTPVKPSGNSLPTSGQRNPTRTNLDQIEPTWLSCLQL